MEDENVQVRISGLAISAFWLGILSLFIIPFQIGFPMTFGILYVIIPISAILVGIVSLIQIEMSAGKVTGKGLAVMGITMPVVVHFGMMLLISFMFRDHTYRMVCGTNLSGIGKAMLIYANDYDDKLPIAGGVEGIWAARIPNWKATNPFEAYNVQQNGKGGIGSISSSFFLLIKYCEATPKHFICGGDPEIAEFKPSEYGLNNQDLTNLWDFGPKPTKHCSYSYHRPFSGFALTSADDPNLAVAADRNPWMDSPFQNARDFSAFDPNGNPKQIRAGNTIVHKKDGQNVLFLDNHVGFEKHSFCGINDDNIYTYWNGSDVQRGTPPKLGSQPVDKTDSLLVNDPAIPR